ncbi:unnamed protein product [Paramecium sonneborni]|uniref:Cullin family profile domain-containing protein n=1 Tax=Paramecium sonneborni TaxID=65129 RepID=A0A8S1QUB8_9CILI|nr:unnamed protein product [Paramecium sonneborni]
MNPNPNTIEIGNFELQIQNLIKNSILSQNYDINTFVSFASKIRKQINNTPNSKQVCINMISYLQKYLLEIFGPKFKNQPELDDFFTAFKQYEKAAHYLNLACYHVCYNLSLKEIFSFWKFAVCKIIKDNIDYIRQNIFKNLENLLDEFYKLQESEFVHIQQQKELVNVKENRENLLNKFQSYIEILLSLSLNEILIQRKINILEDFCQSLYRFIQIEYEQKNKRWFQIYTVQEYLLLVEREFQINQELFICLNSNTKFQSHYQKILRIIYENLLFKYRNVILKDERGFVGLLNQFFTQEISQKEILSQQIVQILRVYSRFQDQERYFIDFKQKFQEFVRKNIEEQYKKATLHHELEKQKSKYKSLVKILCDIYNKFEYLIKLCFRESKNNNSRYDLELIVKSELNKFFINLEQSIYLTLKLCNYVHDLMMQMAKSDDQFQIKDNYDEILKVQKYLLPFVKDFDYYLIIYSYRLASRLLNYLIFFEMQAAQFHLENEINILDQLKQFCGEKKLKKFSQMISETKDLLLQKSIMVYQEYSSEIILINKKKWPVLHENDQYVFKQLYIKKDQYQKQFQIRNQELQITVAFSDTVSFVEIYWNEVDKTLIINCVQAAILFLYDQNDDSKTLNEITEELKLEKGQVLFQLERMVQQKILWNDGDSYFLNDSQIQQEVKENLIVMDHNIYENSNQINQIKTFQDNTQDLKYQLEAFIIKNMKVEKNMNHTNLLEIVQKHFYPTPVNNEKLKESLDFLIKYNYIRRDEKEKSIYHYE